MKNTLLLLCAVMFPVLSFADGSSPLVRAKVGFETGLFQYDTRCNRKFTAPANSPVEYRLPFVIGGNPVGYEVRFDFVTRAIDSEQVAVTVRRSTLEKGVIDASKTENKTITVRKGKEESFNM